MPSSVLVGESHGGLGDVLGSIDVEPHPQRLRVVVDVLVHPSRAESTLEAVKIGPFRGGMPVPVRDLQMHGLVLVVIRARSTDAGQDVEAEGAIGFGVFDRGTLIGPFRRGVIGSRMLQRPGSTASEDEGFQAGVEQAPVEAQRGVERWPHVANLLQLPPDGRATQSIFVIVQEDGTGVPRRDGGIAGFGRHYARAHGRVRPLDLGHVEETGRVSDESSAGKGQLGDGLEATLVQGPCPVRDAPAAVEHGSVERMMLHLLELTVGGEPWVRVVETDNQADADQVIPEMVQPTTTVGVNGQWIAQRMDDLSAPEVLGPDLPHLLDAQRVRLGLAVPAQIVRLDDLFGQTTMAAFGDEGDAGVKLHASGEGGLGSTVSRTTVVVGGDTLDGTIGTIEHLRRREAGIDLNAHLLGLLAEPSGKLTEADDVVAMVVHLRWHWDGHGTISGEEAHAISLGLRRMPKALGVVPRYPAWDQVVDRRRLDPRPRQDVGPDLSSFLQQKHPEVLVAGFTCQLFEPDGGAQACRTCGVFMSTAGQQTPPLMMSGRATHHLRRCTRPLHPSRARLVRVRTRPRKELRTGEEPRRRRAAGSGYPGPARSESSNVLLVDDHDGDRSSSALGGRLCEPTRSNLVGEGGKVGLET